MKINKKIISSVAALAICTNSILAQPIIGNALTSFEKNNYIATTSNNQSYTGIVLKQVNLRASASTKSQIIKKLKVNEEVKIISKEGNFYKIKYSNDSYGYVSTNYIKMNGIVIKNVNLRTSPSTKNSTVIKKLLKNEKVEIIGSSGNYYKIKYDDNKYGYASISYINFEKDSTSEEIKIGIVTKNVNLRTSPSTKNSTVIKKLFTGEEVQIAGTSGNYYKIKYDDNKYGYASINYIEFKNTTIPEEIQEGVVIKNVNLRTSPSTKNSNVIRKLLAGEEVQIAGTSGNYYKIKYDDNKYGYASISYIKLKSEIEIPTSGIGVSTDTIDIRNNPNSTSEVIGNLSKGSKIEIVSTINSFYKVKFNGVYAYIYKDYLEIKENEKLDKIFTLKITKETNCMELASDNSNILTTLKTGTIVNVVENISSGWYKVEINNTYGYIKQSDGSIVNNDEDTNLIIDGNNIYYLNEDGSLFKGGYKVVNNTPYYFDTTTGYATSKLVILKEIEDNKTVTNRYFVKKQGGYLKNEFKTLSNRTYYFGDDGKAYKGIQTINGKTYYFNTGFSYMTSGLCTYNKQLYYFNEDTYEIETNCSKSIADKITIYLNESGQVYKYEKLDDSTLANVIASGLDKIGSDYSTYDCSGFITSILNEGNLNIFTDHIYNSHEQALYCKEHNLIIDVNSLEPGDLIFYNQDNCNNKALNGFCDRECEDGMHIHHVAMYIGNGKIIESSNSTAEGAENTGVRISNLDFSKDRTYYIYTAAKVIDINSEDNTESIE